MTQSKQFTIRLVLLILTITLIALYVLAESERTSHQRTLHTIEIHQNNLITKINALFTPIQQNRSLSNTEIMLSNQHIASLQSSIDVLSNIKILNNNTNTQSMINELQTLIRKLNPLIKSLEQSQNQLSLEQRTQTLFKNQLTSTQKRLTQVRNTHPPTQENRDDLIALDMLVTLVNEALVYEDVLISAQQQDPLITAEIKSRLINSINRLINTPILHTTFNEPRTRTQIRQIQLAFQKTTDDNSDFFSDSQPTQQLMTTLQAIQKLKKTPEQLKITSILHNYNPPFYTRLQFQIIHTTAIMLLTLGLGLGLGFPSQKYSSSTINSLFNTGFNSPSNTTTTNDHDKLQLKENVRKKQLMKTLRALDIEKTRTQTTLAKPPKKVDIDPTIQM